MARPRIRLTLPATSDPAAELAAAFARLRVELHLPDSFSPEVEAEARRAIAEHVLPERDETGVPFVTIDPPGSMDLDQALYVERSASGHRVRYAIADLPSFVEPGSALDQETRRRGQTVYAPDGRVPLHPAELSEDAASLLPDQRRAAYVWDIDLDETGEVVGAELYRATVMSRRRYTYEEVQALLDTGEAEDTLVALTEVGTRRARLELARGGASLPMPDQEVSHDEDGYHVTFRPPLACEEHNAQISLLTGMTAAQMMLHAGVGILRTMPPADHDALVRYRRQARALGLTWPAEQPYGEFLASLDRHDPDHLALIHEATALFRGAGYTPFDGTIPEQAIHAAIAAPYAHVTAPLRRLVDRFGLVVCAAVSAGEEVPSWCRAALPSLPEAMGASDRVARAMERGSTDAVEAAELSAHVGQQLPGSVVDCTQRGLVVQLTKPAVLATAHGNASLGDAVVLRVDRVDITAGQVRLTVVEASS